MQIWVVALPGVRILPGEELYAAYGKNYWLDHLSTLSQAARRACISKYKYRPSELLKAGLNPDGSRSPPAPSILPFLCSSPRMEPTTHALFLREETVQVNSIFRLHFAQPSLPRLLYDPALPLFEKRALLRTYFLTEPTPEYLISNLLSGAHILPPEVILRASPREGRKLQHRFYRKVDLEWDTLRSDAANLNKFANVFTADMVRLVENPSANIMKEEILYGSFRIYKFQLLEEDVNKINAELAMQSEREVSDVPDRGLLISNMGGYHSNVDKFFNHTNRLLGELSAAAVSLVEAHDQAYLKGKSIDKKNYIRAFAAYADSEGWVNRNQHGHWNSLHTHIGSAWSGVYYVHLPAAEVTARAYSGRLLLKATPHITELKHDLSDLERSRLNLSKDTSNPHYRRDDILGYCDYAEFAPVAGEMIIFPSYLQHAVLPLAIKEEYRDTPAGTRISFAFNFAEKFV